MKASFYIGLAMLALAFSCDEDVYEPATVTFYPALQGETTEPETGSTGAATTVKLVTSRVMTSTSQVNIRITGEGAGYGYSYITSPPMLEPGIVTLTIPAGEAEASFTFTPVNDGIFMPRDYAYTFEIEAYSNMIKSAGQRQFTLKVADNTEPFALFDFDDCTTTPVGFTEAKVSGDGVMQANTWGCSSFGYPNETTTCAEANAYNKGGSAPSNSYLVMASPVDGSQYQTLFVSALVYSRYTGEGQIKFRYSTNYSGSGDPEAEGVTWADLEEANADLPAAGSQKWTSVGALLEDVGDGNIYFAIQFVGGTSSSSSNWRIENFSLKGI